MPDLPTLDRLPRWTLTCVLTGESRTLHATSARGAWGKYCTLYFGALKPARTDYTIRVAPPRKESA